MNRYRTLVCSIVIMFGLSAVASQVVAAGNSSAGSSPKATGSGSVARFNLKFKASSPHTSSSFRWESAHQTSDGGFIMISSDEGAGIAITRTTAAGKKSWERLFGYTAPNLPTSTGGHGTEVLETPDGGFLAIGMLNYGRTSDELWIVRLTREGRTVWEKRYNGNALGAKKNYEGLLGTALILNPDGSFLVGVRVWNGDYCILAKFDPSGELRWNRQFQDATMSVNRWHQSMDRLATFRAIRLTRLGEGCLMAYNIKEPGVSGQHVGIRLLKLDEQGDTIWSTDLTKSQANMTRPMLHALITTSDGGFTLFGNRGTGAAFVAKYGQDGQNQWVLGIGGFKTYGGGIVELPNDTYALCTTSDIGGGTGLMFAKVMGPDPVTGKRFLAGKKVYGTKEKSVHHCDSMERTRDGGYILAGMHFIQYKGGNGWLAKTDADGNIPAEPLVPEPKK